ncbi:MAG: hypothetical protein E7130_04265 [Rikenellaceae bacterium]|nr:hypothetical protein [Rikenellaceae bacterium]
MRTKVLSILIILFIVAGFASAYDHRMQLDEQPLASTSAASGERDGKVVDLKADVVYPITIDGDSTVYCLVGNFVAHHNGAVIVCDSAVRYSDKRIECFGNVLINQGTTFVYGDRAEYNGEINEAEVFSQLVKVVDEDVTLYTYKFKFNTLESVGVFADGGVVTKENNMLESDRGYFYSKRDEIVCVDNVEMTGDEYRMKGDSVIYNIKSDRAQFFTGTNIWNSKGEYLYADRGSYEKDSDRYVITLNGYILTENEEIWSDSLDYYRERGYGLLRRNIQLDDQKHKLVAFGDWGEYWKEPGNAMLTLDPSTVSYDLEQGDSVFMRADTMFLYSRSTQGDILEKERAAQEAQRLAEEARIADSVKQAEAAQKISEAGKKANGDATSGDEGDKDDKKSARRDRNDKGKEKRDRHGAATHNDDKSPRDLANAEERLPSAERSAKVSAKRDSTSVAAGVKPTSNGEKADSVAQKPAIHDSLSQADADSVKVLTAADSLKARLDTLPKAERKALLKEIARKERDAKVAAIRKVRDSIRTEQLKIKKAKLDSIGELRQQKRNVILDRMKAREDTLRARAKAREEARKLRMIARLTRKGVKLQWADSVTRATADSTLQADLHLHDSILTHLFDSLYAKPVDSLAVDSVKVDTAIIDTQYRLVLGYRNVRIFRKDFQGVCDSLSASSLDSVIHMYIAPILWHEQNQVTSEQVDMYTANQQLTRAEFTGKPMMVSKIDTLHYNQVAGKTMISHFRNNNIYRNDVDGNAQTIYYMQEDGSPEVQGLMYIESADMTFYIEDKTVSGITYRGNPTYTIYPMDKIPETQPLFLQGFAWHEDKRPAQDSVFTRTLRPSIRSEKMALPQPKFPISERIREYRTRLVERNEWHDRNDILTQEVLDWLETQTDWKEQSEKARQQRSEYGK